MKPKKRRQREFLRLAERFRKASDTEEAKGLGDALGRMLFGADLMPELNEDQMRLIKKGLRAAEEGKLVSHTQTKNLIAEMGRRKRGGSAKVRG